MLKYNHKDFSTLSKKEDATTVLTNISDALNISEKEAQDRPAALLIVGGELNGQLFDIIEEKMTVGRSVTNSIPLDFPGISRVHFAMQIIGKDIIISDNESKNGTFLNNQRIEKPTALGKGDVIKVGSIALKYIPQGDPERLAYDKLNKEANMDGHTGCYNKTYFNRMIELEVKKSQITGEPLSLILFDLDHFKNLNDTYGHDAGDYVLAKAASLVREFNLKKQDLFARYGGEEFVILLSKCNIKNAFYFAEEVRKRIATTDFVYDDKKLPVSVSIGVADYRQGVATGNDLFRRCDKALYMSKERGRNQVQFFKN